MSFISEYTWIGRELAIFFLENWDRILVNLAVELAREQVAAVDEEEEFEEYEDDDDDDGDETPFAPGDEDEGDADDDDEDQQAFQVILNNIHDVVGLSRAPYRPRSPRRQEPSHRVFRKVSRHRIRVVPEDSDEDEIPIERPPRGRLPERFPTTTLVVTIHHPWVRGSRPLQGPNRGIDPNPCRNTCMRFPLTETSCLKWDLHTFVYYFASCLRLCQIVWETVPATELPRRWEVVDRGAEEPRRMCGWTWWWKIVEDRTDGEIYAWKARKVLDRRNEAPSPWVNRSLREIEALEGTPNSWISTSALGAPSVTVVSGGSRL